MHCHIDFSFLHPWRSYISPDNFKAGRSIRAWGLSNLNNHIKLALIQRWILNLTIMRWEIFTLGFRLTLPCPIAQLCARVLFPVRQRK
jgi:hypothetical protein